MLVPLPNLPGLFSSVEWSLVIPQQKSASEFTGRTQVIGLPGAEHWRVKASALPHASEAESRSWRAFIVACRGAENTFNMPAMPLAAFTGANPSVTAAVAGNRAVTVSSVAGIVPGMVATVTQVGGRYRKVVVVGIVGLNVQFEPYLTANPLVGAAFNLDAPFCTMRLSGNEHGWQRGARVAAGFAFEAEEAL